MPNSPTRSGCSVGQGGGVSSMTSKPRPIRSPQPRRRIGIMLCLLCSACPLGGRTQGTQSGSPQIANLHAFARLYGVLRWFHPSDAASALDWDSFAVEGARRVMDAPDIRTLRNTLEELITPFAPTVHFTLGDK